MESMPLLEAVEFHDKNPYAEPLLVAEDGRVLRFALRPGQIVREHSAPHSPVYLVVLQGQGMFAGADGQEKPFGPNTLLIFEAGENHSLRAMNEEVVCIAFLREAPGTGHFKSRLITDHRAGGRKV
jgi:quercetin dioxygenase-like cupin family protein